MSNEWVLRANCATGIDPEEFFPNKQVLSTVAAKAACADCPVQMECLRWALDHNESGVWGGTTDHERRKLREGSVRHEKCVQCGTPFETTSRLRKFCSSPCRKRAHEMRKPVAAGTCQDCGAATSMVRSLRCLSCSGKRVAATRSRAAAA